MADESSLPACAEPLLSASQLNKTYRLGHRVSRSNDLAVAALRNVSLAIPRGRIFGLTGESGSGKTTLARCLACLERPDTGHVWMGGCDLLTLKGSELRHARRQIQVVFQAGAASLNPNFSALEIVSEPIRLLPRQSKRRWRDQALALMDSVGIRADLARRRPSELSGGQRQRLAIARALALAPKLLILDEPMRGLDLPVQAQIANLLVDLQSAYALTSLFISHDIRLTLHLADELAIMQHGCIVEHGPAKALARNPQHRHTRALISAAAQLWQEPPV